MSETQALLRITVKEEVTTQMKKAREELEKFKKQSNDVAKSAKDMFKELAGPAAGLASAAGFVLLSKEAVNAASQLQALQRRAEAIYGDSFPQMTAEAERMAAALHRSSSDVLGFATGMASIMQGAGVGSQALDAMSGSLAQLTVQFGSFFHIADDEAFQVLQGGILGAGKALQRYGVIVNDSTLAEYAHSLGITEKIENMSEAQKVTLRYGLIMQETDKIQETATDNIRTFDDAVKEFQGNWHDLLELLGAPALSMLADLLGSISGFMKETFIPAWQLAGQEIQAFFQLLNEKIPVLKGVYEDFARLWGTLVDLKTVLTSDYHEIQSYTPDIGYEQIEQAKAAAEKSGGSIRSEFAKIQASAKAAQPDVKKLYDQAAGGSGGGEAAARELKKIKDAMDDLEEKYQDAVDDIDDKMTELAVHHHDKMESINDDIDKTIQSLDRLKKKYGETMSDLTGDKYSAVAKQQQKIKELEAEFNSNSFFSRYSKDQAASAVAMLDSYRRNTDHTDITAEEQHAFGWNSDTTKQLNTYMQLTKAKADLDKVLAGRADKEDLLAGAKVESGKSDFEKQFENFDKQAQRESEAYAERKGDLEDELSAQNKKKTAEEQDYATLRQSMEDTKIKLKEWHDDYLTHMTDMKNVTMETVKSMAKDLDKINSILSEAQAAAQRLANMGLSTNQGGGTSGSTTSQGSPAPAGGGTSGSTTSQAVASAWDALAKANGTYGIDGQSNDASVIAAREAQAALLAKARASISGYGRAGGGNVTESMTWVGEYGPEMVSLPYGSRVHTAAESRSMSGSGTINVYMGGVVVKNEADEDRLVQKITREIQLTNLKA